MHDARMSRDTETARLIYERKGSDAALRQQAKLAEEYCTETTSGISLTATYSPEDVAVFYGLLADRKKALE